MRKDRLILLFLILMLMPLMAESVAINEAGTAVYGGAGKAVALTASDSVYWPSSSGIAIKDFEYFGYSITMTEATGTDPNVTVTLEVTNSETVNASSTWKAYTQSCFYPIDGSASGTLTITDENEDQGSLHFKPSTGYRFKLTENATDTDITATITMTHQ